MSVPANRMVWTVRGADELPRRAAFDAVVVIHGRALDGLSVLTNVDVPFERELPDTALTLVVRSNGNGKLITTCSRVGADNTPLSYGRSHSPLGVFVFSGGGMIVTGLPEQPT